MLIVCPSCAASYSIDPVSLGSQGRTVRCSRCKNAWFEAPAPAPTVKEFVADVIAEAEAQAQEPAPPTRAEIFSGPPAKDEVAEFSAALHEPGAEPVPAPPETSIAPAIIDATPVSAPPASAPAGGEDIESFAARRERRQNARKRARRLVRQGMLILALVAFNGALILWRTDVVRAFPQTASLYSAVGFPVNLRGLVFNGVQISKETHDGVDVLVVEGNIVNVTARPVEVPRMRFAVRNAAGHEIYTWTAQPTRGILPAGDMLPFRSRLASPPADSKDVLVRFFNRRDVIAGVK